MITDQDREDARRTREMRERWDLENEWSIWKLVIFAALIFLSVFIPILMVLNEATK